MHRVAQSYEEAVQLLKKFARENGVRFSLVDDVKTTEEGYMYDADRKPVYRWRIVREENEQDNSITVTVEVQRI